MSTHRYIDVICVSVLLLTILITVLFMNGEAFGLRVIVDTDAEDYAGTELFTENDRNGAWDSSKATRITLNGDRISVSGGGAYAYNGDVMITSGGKYLLSGTLDDGSIVVDADGSAKVWILLDSVTLRCSDGACVDIEQADKVFLTLAEGSENSMTTAGFSPENQNAKMDGTLFSRDDLTINGSGSLNVTALAEHGIVCNDELVVTGGKITVSAPADALHANDSLRIMTAELDLTGGDDGVSVTSLTEGGFLMDSGNLIVTASDNGISAGFNVEINGGSLRITAEDKGISAENTVAVTGGTLTIESEDDGISSTGEIHIAGGDLTITTADDGIHSDSSVRISGGTVQIPACYEGIEAVTIDVSGGDITISPEDDGMNANGGENPFGGFGGGGPGGFGGFGGGMPAGGPPEMPDRDSMPEPPEMPDPENNAVPAEMEASGNGEKETWIHVSGGNITVVNGTARDADGLDSNGDIIISGGVIRVSLTNSGMNSALDYGSESGGVMEISGGEVIACGSYAMAEGFDSTSEQCSVLYNIRRGAPAGTAVSLEDSEGNVLLSWEVPCSFSSVEISCPEMKLGESYTIVIGDSAEEITLEAVSASFGDAQSEGFGGPMNWGGMKFRPGGMRPETAPGASAEQSGRPAGMSAEEQAD